MNTASGPGEDFKKIWDAHAKSVRNFLWYKCGDEALAQDLMQEAFIRLWNKWSDIDPEKAKSFLFTVANNLFLDHVRHQKVVLKFQDSPRQERSAKDPQFELEEKEFKAQLEKAISDLPEGSREVFLMNRIESLSYKQIAEKLSISVKAVEKRMSKALKELRKLYKKI